MNRTLVTLTLLAGMLTAISAQGQAPAGKPKAPVIPSQAVTAERSALTQCAMLVSKGQFDQAAAKLQPLAVPPVVHVFVDWAPVPKRLRTGYRQSVESALHEWNAALGGAPRAELTSTEENADLRVLFERGVALVRTGQAQLVCSDTSLDMLPPEPPLPGQPAIYAPSGPTSTRREATVRVALNVPYTAEPHSTSSVARLMGQALGSYLGLAPVADPNDVMGPDNHSTGQGCKPSAEDVRVVRALQDARTQLAGFAQKRVAAYMPRAVMVLETPEVDAGDVQRGDAAHYVFKLKNTGDAPLEVDAKPNCGCTVASFDKLIAPGAEGKVSADFHTTGYRGKVMKLIDVFSNDPEQPKTSLRLVANVLSAVQVLPGETAIIPLKSTEPTVKEFEIRTSAKENVEITKAACAAPYASVKLDPAPAPADGGKAYKLAVTIAPTAPVGRSVFVVTVTTSSPKEPQVTLTAICDKGVLAIPQSLFMGSIGPQTTLPLMQIVTLTKSDGAFHIKKASCDDAKLAVEQTTVKEGSQYQIRLTYKGGWPAGAVRSRIVVETDDPQQSRIEIPVMANVIEGAR